MSRYSYTNSVSTISTTYSRNKKHSKTVKEKIPDLFENARIELEKEKKWKKFCEMKKELKRKESSQSNQSNQSSVSTIDGENTNRSWMSGDVVSNMYTFEEQNAFFNKNIIDQEKTSRENLFLITKQLCDIFGKLELKNNNIKRKKKVLNIKV